jgi:hypothetical protein
VIEFRTGRECLLAAGVRRRGPERTGAGAGFVPSTLPVPASDCVVFVYRFHTNDKRVGNVQCDGMNPSAHRVLRLHEKRVPAIAHPGEPPPQLDELCRTPNPSGNCVEGPRAAEPTAVSPYATQARQMATMPSPPTASGTVTVPIGDNELSELTRNSSTLPAAPVCT